MNTERIKMVRDTIVSLKQALLEELDPRDRTDIAETIDRLESSLDYEVDKIATVLEEQQRNQKTAA